MMDKYYLATSVPPPKAQKVLIKESGNHYSKWDGSKWVTDGDVLQYLMGDHELKVISMQEAEEHMRGIAP